MPLPSIQSSDLMLATLGKRPFKDPDWIFELKYDGYRCLVRKSGDLVELLSRNGNELGGSFPDVAAAVASIPADFVLDAELTVDEPNGRSSFEWLRRRAVTKTVGAVRAAAARHPARLYFFDALCIGDEDLRGLPLEERKGHLRELFDDTKTMIVATGIVGEGRWVFEQAAAHDLEGMVAKRLDAPYQSGRSRDWIKVKNPDYSRREALGWGKV
jgi:bifunctional non-homologous end joining protein LigD